MKKIFFLSVCLFFGSQHLFAVAEKPQEVKAPITAVKIYLDAASITHSQKVKLKTGANKLVFVGLAAAVRSNTINLRNIGNADLLRLSLVRISDTTDISSLPKDVLEIIKKSKDSLLTTEASIVKLKSEIEALSLEKEMLYKNDGFVSNGKQISTAELKLATDFYRNRNSEVNMELYAKQKELKQLKKSKLKLVKSVFNVDSEEEKDMTINVVIAELNNTGEEYTTAVELAYLADGAGWIASYNIYASSKEPLKIDYKAKILNNTGIDWSNMELTLSTADPSQYYAAPDLDPYYIGRYSQNNNRILNGPQSTENTKSESIYVPDREITFTIKKNYSFNSGSTPYWIDVKSYDINPEFLYRCAPKKEEQVYAIAKINDWEKLDLIDGEANIYTDGTFLGKSYIRPSEIDDYLELPLGVVSSIFVKHKLVSEFSNKRVLANEVTATLSYEIKLKNNGTNTATIEVLDQVPVSEESSVKTSIIEMTEGGEKDALTGLVIWKVDLAASSDKTLVLKYSVTYPKRKGYGMSKAYSKQRQRAKF